ncbi:MAG: hypothetical protein AAF214_11890 [Pseudomonadota bacterium]
MCSACGYPAAPGHWTEAGAVTPHDRLRERFRRTALLHNMLKPQGIQIHDGGLVPGIQIKGPDGAETIVGNLEQLWIEVERILGRPFDPLQA